MRSMDGVGMTPPNVLGTPKPASSVMISRTFGAPLGGTTVGGHHGVDPGLFSVITPPNFGAGGGSCWPLSVVVALGEPNVPVTCWADTVVDPAINAAKPDITASAIRANFILLTSAAVETVAILRHWVELQMPAGNVAAGARRRTLRRCGRAGSVFSRPAGIPAVTAATTAMADFNGFITAPPSPIIHLLSAARGRLDGAVTPGET